MKSYGILKAEKSTTRVNPGPWRKKLWKPRDINMKGAHSTGTAEQGEKWGGWQSKIEKRNKIIVFDLFLSRDFAYFIQYLLLFIGRH